MPSLQRWRSQHLIAPSTVPLHRRTVLQGRGDGRKSAEPFGGGFVALCKRKLGKDVSQEWDPWRDSRVLRMQETLQVYLV